MPALAMYVQQLLFVQWMPVAEMCAAATLDVLEMPAVEIHVELTGYVQWMPVVEMPVEPSEAVML